MLNYIIKRLLLIIPVVLSVILLVFAILYITPGSKISNVATHQNDKFDAFLDKFFPKDGFFAHYARYCYNFFFKLQFGTAGRHDLDITKEVFRRWSWTLKLSGYSLLVSIFLGIPLGIISAIKNNGWQDRSISTLTTLLSSVPSYCIAIALALLFALKLKIFPSYGVQQKNSLVLPVITVSAMGISQFIRVVRASVLENLEKNYITALRAAGLKESSVIGLHALRNALVPILASLGENATKILGGCFVAEKFFAIPGIGFYLIQGVTKVEQEVILACATTMSVLLVFIHLVSDLISLLADPQLRKSMKAGVSREK